MRAAGVPPGPPLCTGDAPEACAQGEAPSLFLGRSPVRITESFVAMAKQIDVYRNWLGITETARPLDYYTLLKLKRFEDAVDKIRANYRQLNAHVRKYAAGEFGPQSQALLNELAKAMLCLTDAHRKAEYDATHGRTTKHDGGRRAIELILLA